MACPQSRIIITYLNKTVKTRPRPIRHTPHQPVFHRVVMDIIPVVIKIRFVPYGMFPKTPLPDGCFAPLLTGEITAFLQDLP